MRTIKRPAQPTGFITIRHKACGGATRVDVRQQPPGHWAHSDQDWWRNGNRVPKTVGLAAGGRREVPGYDTKHYRVPCAKCGVPLYLTYGEMIYGRYDKEIVCGGKCMNATGPSCDCQCGGMNHGAGHGTIIEGKALMNPIRRSQRRRNPAGHPHSMNVMFGMVGMLYGAYAAPEESRGASAIGFGLFGYLLGSVLSKNERPQRAASAPRRQQQYGFGGGYPGYVYPSVRAPLAAEPGEVW